MKENGELNGHLVLPIFKHVSSANLNELQLQVLAQQSNMQQLKVVCLLEGHGTLNVVPLALEPHYHLFSQDAKMRLMHGQRQQNQVRIQTIQAVPCVGPVLVLAFEASNKLHNLVLPLAGHAMPAEDNLKRTPGLVVLELALDEVHQMFLQQCHKPRPRRDAVGVKWSRQLRVSCQRRGYIHIGCRLVAVAVTVVFFRRWRQVPADNVSL